MRSLFKLSTFSSLGIGITASIICLQLSTNSAQAAFTCGPNMSTYRVTSPDGTLGGVRCVKFINADSGNGRTLLFVWYGEGKWGDTKYRHVGTASIDRSSGKQVNQAIDIYGNGEGTDGVFNQLDFDTSSTNNRIIKVSAGWNEIWTFALNNVVEDYSSRLRPLRSCGKNLHRYAVTNSGDQSDNGTGVRCINKVGNVWYGEGNWNGVHYAHIGFRAYQGYGATDICEPSKSEVCGNFPIGSLEVTSLGDYCSSPEKLKFGGGWSEVWTNNPATNVKTCL
jgi:hypothetical protein